MCVFEGEDAHYWNLIAMGTKHNILPNNFLFLPVLLVKTFLNPKRDCVAEMDQQSAVKSGTNEKQLWLLCH